MDIEDPTCTIPFDVNTLGHGSFHYMLVKGAWRVISPNPSHFNDSPTIMKSLPLTHTFPH